MKVLLCEDVEKLGYYGDVVEVKDGFARNYLLPQKMAVMPTDSIIKSMEREKTKRAEHRKVERNRLEKIAKTVENAEAVISLKANEQGHLFGSVGPVEIAANLREQGFEIADKMVSMKEHIKEVGKHKVALKMAVDLIVTIDVVVVAEGQPQTAEEPKPTEVPENSGADGESKA